METKKRKVSKKLLFLWPTRTIALAVATSLFGYVTYFATDFMELPAATVGMIFMLSKIFDGITDVIAGLVIDKTHTRLGKGRPYELAFIGYVASLVLLFAAPEMGITPSCIWLFVTYSLINSVFMTLLNCNEPVYLSNVLERSEDSVTVNAVTGFVSMLVTMVCGMIMPNVVNSIGTTRKGWLMIAAVMSVPCTLFGLIRFATIKEQKLEKETRQEKFTVKDMLKAIIGNKYILLFALLIFLSNVGSNLISNVQTYYFKYIMGDLSLVAAMSLSMLAIIVVIILTPGLSKKFGFTNVIRATSLLGMAGYLVRILAPRNLTFLFVTNIFSMLGFYTMFTFAGTFVIQCIDYGEWKTGRRSEGTIACAQSVTAKIGTAIGVAVVGLLMGLSGYNGTLDVQPDSANNMIIAMYSIIPGVFCLIQFIILKFYDLDKLLPQIQADLAEKHALKEK